MTKKSCRYLRVLIFLCAVCLIPTIAQGSSHYWAPWVTQTTTNSSTINWRSDTNESGKIYYSTTSYFNQHHSFENTISAHTSAQYQHIQLTGLEPNTSYTYWVRPSGDKSAFGNRTFRTFPISGPFTFIVFGDTREGVNYFETQRFKYVADAIANESNVLFVINGGDFVRHDYTPRWATFFQCADRMLANTTIFPVIGNHEYHNISNKDLDEEHYTVCPEHCIPCNKCAPATDAVNYKSAFDMPLNYSFDCVGVRFIILNSPDPNSTCCDDPHTTLSFAEGQAPWLEQLLKNNNRGVFTLHHHPIWDAGNTSPNSDLIPWENLYHKYNISANFVGHTHNYQRYDISGIPYFVVGNGGAPNDDVNSSTKYPAGLQSVLPMQLGYLKVTVDPENNTATAWEVTVGKLSCWQCPDLPQLYNPPIINDTITFPLKSYLHHPTNATKPINKEQITTGNNQGEAYGSGLAANKITIVTSQEQIRSISPQEQKDVGWVTGFPANGYGVILHTTDGGKNWTRQGSPNTIPNVILYDIRAIDANNAWAVGDADSNYVVVLRTMDGGKTWLRCGSPGYMPDFGALGIGAVDNNIAWVVGSSGAIIHTEDGGKTWVQQASNTKASLMKVAALDRYNAWIVGATDNGYAIILRTSDGGLTWTRQGNASTIKTSGLIDVSAVDNRTAWAVGVDYAVLKTTDGGASWQIQMINLSGFGHMNGACAIDKYNAWITQDYGDVYWTNDGGKTWNEQKPTVASGGWLLSASAKSLEKAWVVGFSQNGRDGIIIHTTNRGANWTEQFAPVNVPFDRISFVGARS